MDDLLLRIMDEANSIKLVQITSSCCSVREIVCDKSTMLKGSMSDLRSKCFLISKMALSSDNKTLKTLALNFLQFIVRDDMFWVSESDDPEELLPNQLLDIMQSIILDQTENIQINLLKIVVELSSIGSHIIDPFTIEKITELCLLVFKQNNPSSSVAAQATVNQSLQCYLKSKLDATNLNEIYEQIFEKYILPILLNLSQKLEDNRKLLTRHGSSKGNDTLVTCFLLKIIHVIFIFLPTENRILNKKCSEFVWKVFCPLLIRLLSIEINKTKLSKIEKMDFNEDQPGHGYGRGSECIGSLDSETVIMKDTYNIAQELVRLFGTSAEMRPVLESLFHRMLLYPPVHSRLNILKSIKVLLGSPELLVKFTVLSSDIDHQQSKSNDLALLKIVIDSIKECSYSSEYDILDQSIKCISTLLKTLEMITKGKGFENHGNHRFESTIYQSFDNYEPVDSDIFLDESCEDVELNLDDKLKSTFFHDKSFKIDELADYKNKLTEIIKSSSMSEENESEFEGDNVIELEADDSADLGEETFKKDILFDEDFTESIESDTSELEDGNNFEEKSDFDSDEIPVESILSSLNLMYEKNKTENLRRRDNYDEVAKKERESAKSFFKLFQDILSQLLLERSSVRIDECLQEFSSKFCQNSWENQRKLAADSKTTDFNEQIVIINGDGIYLACYYGVLLNLRLLKCNYYDDPLNKTPPLTERQFVDQIHASGLLIYLSSTWLAELYQQILTTNLLLEAGYDMKNIENNSLINLIIDLDSLTDTSLGSQALSDYRRIRNAFGSHGSADLDIIVENGKSLVKKIFSAFWNSILTIFSSLFRDDQDIQKLLIVEKENAEQRETLVKCLDALQTSAKLCIILGFQPRCHAIFDLLTKSVIKSEIESATNFKSKIRMVRKNFSADPTFRFHYSQLLSLKVILTCCLEIGSHSPPCWQFVFESCQFIFELENDYFLHKSKARLTKLSSLIKPNKPHENDLAYGVNSVTDIDRFSISGFHVDTDALKNLEKCISDCLNDISNTKGILKDNQFEVAIQCLYQLTEKVFDDASKLNLSSLKGFLNALIDFSRKELSFQKRGSPQKRSNKPLLFNRFCDVTLRVARSGRPLVQLLQVWSLVVPHLIEGACNKKDAIYKISISTLNDFINIIISSSTELPHFHFNEALFKPYENLLLLELCDSDVQEMIISSICGFVEGSAEEIKSGWRSLFGALKGIKLPSIPSDYDAADAYELEVEKVRQLRVILDIFEAFLNTNNLEIFANAAIDCLLCLLRLLKDPIEEESPTQSRIALTEEVNEFNPHSSVDLCLVSLKYLHQFESTLRSMYKIPICPFFSQRANPLLEPRIIDVPSFCDSKIKAYFHVPLKLLDIDSLVKVLHVWFLLLDELCNSIISCPKHHQSKIIETTLSLVGSLRTDPGPEFAIYCINHIILPFSQKYLLSVNNHLMQNMVWTNLMANCKRFCGLVSHLIVEHIKLIKSGFNSSLNLVLAQSLAIFVEIFIDSSFHEALCNLSASCMMHIICELSSFLEDKNSWEIICKFLFLGAKLTLRSLTELTSAFNNKSIDFYDDLNEFKVITQRDTLNSINIRVLAQKIFLLDTQRKTERSSKIISPEPEYRSFVFVIGSEKNVEDPEDSIKKGIPFTRLVYELNCHQIIIKMAIKLLLHDIDTDIPNLPNFHEVDENTSFLLHFEDNHIQILMDILLISREASYQFDIRPGLKFLIQKVGRFDVPANLYYQTYTCSCSLFMLYIHLFNSDISFERKEAYKTKTKIFFEQLCDEYTDFIVENDKCSSSLDQISDEPVIFMATSIPDLRQLMYPYKLEIPTANFNGKCEEVNDDQLDQIAAYKIASQKTINKMSREYKKWKSLHAPMPPTIDEKLQRKNNLQKKFPEIMSESVKSNANNILKDSVAYKSLWTELIIACINHHLSLPTDKFIELIPVFENGIHILIIFGVEKELRKTLSLWNKKLCSISSIEITKADFGCNFNADTDC